jgi:exopolyphosphatase/guanosine-5'-triphosphate,3'-diphosphate pyrophosphatase
LAGTVSTLAMLELGITDYDRSRVHHAVLARDSVERWAGILAQEETSVRRRRRAISPGREDVIVGGVLVLEAAMRRFGFATCLVSEADILDGLVASLTP